MPDRFSANSNPIFDIVVATTVAIRQRAARLHVACRQQQNRIPIDHVPIGVAKKRAIGIAIESHAQIETSPVGIVRHKTRHRLPDAAPRNSR